MARVCAMSGACGSVDWTGQQIPCPYNGPAIDVRVPNWQADDEVPIALTISHSKAGNTRISRAARVRMWL